ncbi:hypothetical protein Smp_159130 [Schistosoma mansoni]|uniref:hypothetical protein n=1 Tax=Schistosoma mansoni TaxID=6183 RepID=UPI00022DCB2E|nr:hypothetical protein Smp_159130 [Schistosoma mansoni]|eukprot:XP_018654597.1 hypothetical protein Smp_159130 [Schistosoma mansoni]
MAGMVSYTALYREEVYHLCQLTEKFTDVDRIHFSGDDLNSLDIGEEVIQRLPTDTPVSNRLENFKIYTISGKC